MKLEAIQALHNKVIHSREYTDQEMYKEDSVIERCSASLLSLVCKKCFGTQAGVEEQEEMPAVVDRILAKHQLKWLARPYRIENRNGDVIMRGPIFDLTEEGIRKALQAARKARTREEV